MAEKVLRFLCAYSDCLKETTVIVKIARPYAMRSQPISEVRYCEHCSRPNKLLIPDNLDVHQFVLGKDKGFLGYSSKGIPRLQGEQVL